LLGRRRLEVAADFHIHRVTPVPCPASPRLCDHCQRDPSVANGSNWQPSRYLRHRPGAERLA